ncbi:MAG TPA: alpha-2-macroglobulin family protein, partial [Sandaracinaceae bacterium LLY-WYZ-13_1]|nr:alpha-2-macroglobulin family protein [Sandaracinaceae bacterium LLY-WYZ-13_1]
RTPPRRLLIRRAWLPWVAGGLVALLALLAGLLWPGDEDRDRPSLGSVPPGLFDDVDAWPVPAPDLPPATPLAPLLVADRPDALAVLSPAEGAIRLRRGQSLTVRFNRPMVEGWQVGRALEASPLVLEPAVAGQARWTSRSQLAFQPEPDAWSTGVREVALGFTDDLASLSGEPLVDGRERVLVLDGAPRVLSHRSRGRVEAGAPLPLVFDAPVSLATLAREMLAYEIDGGQRSVPVRLVTSRRQPEHGFRVDVRMRRGLEPGARVGVALAPRYLPWGGTSPAVMTYELAPRPHLEGVACPAGAAHAGQCRHRGSPGRVIEIGPTLRLLSSARLADVRPSSIRIRPALPNRSVRLAPHGPPAGRLIEVDGEWAPDQVYEVRVGGLRTEAGEPVRPLPPLAVRSSGHPPEVRVATGALSFEAEAPPVLPFAAIHPAPGDLLHRPVEAGDELRALVSPATFARDGGRSAPLAPLAPDARPNRWGPGRYRWRDEDRSASMAVVAFRPDASSAPGRARTAFVQSTDLGVTVRAHRDGLLVWVTSLSSAAPVEGAVVTVADAEAHQRATGRTDADGVAGIELDADPLVVSHALRVVAGDDRAALLLDPRRAIGPSAMGLSPGAAQPADAPVATVFTDRGAYRPGEGMHAKLVLRRIDGARARAVRQGRFRVRLFGPSGAAPFRETEVRPSRFGTASVDFELPLAAELGTWRLEVARPDRDEALGRASVRVAEFRQPTFRVDLSAVEGPVHDGDEVGLDASATYLFGAPVTRGRLRWSLDRAGGASYPERWRGFRFTPVGARAGRGTLAGGEEALGASGAVHLDARVELAAAARTRLELEAEVTDGAGHTHATRRAFVAYPSAVEVGLRDGDDWVELGEALSVEAVAIDHEGAPVAGRAITARVLREGWHSWWEWSDRARGSYRMRRDQRREVVHRCALRSGEAPVGCAFTPSRPGTYVLEVEAEDANGRTSRASRRLYVAGPDEHPDRDPPGAPIEVTPVRTRWTVGETAELAFESPWPDAEALITVERDGVLHLERRRVSGGGQVVRLPVTAEMVPNAFVGVTLVRPRAGPPAEDVDLNAPDLRFGIAELRVTPATGALEVTVETETRARPGAEVPVTVQVRDAGGRPVRGEVALWAVDEGTLRLTGYRVPDPTEGLFRPRAPAFAWEDLRRQLVSRVAPPPMPEASGDGSEGRGEARRMLDDRERFDPTPLWAPQLTTDQDGRATATLTLPARPTEYRVMAVAVDAGARAGRASTSLVAEQPVVVRPAFPRFLTAGDRFEAAAFVHNATEAPLTVRVFATVGGTRREARELTLTPGGEARVAETVTAPSEGPLELRFDAEAAGESVAVRDAVPVVPRGRFVRSQVFVAAEGAREISVGLPEGTPNAGTATVTVASHPFVGFEGAIDALEGSAWAGTEPTAATLLALAAYARLDVADPAHGIAPDELEARGRRLAARLLGLQNVDGGFGRWSARGATLPHETSLAIHALTEAHRRSWVDDEEALRSGREALAALARGAAFADHYGERGLDRLAYALRVLADAGQPQGARASALHEQRERLSPYGLSQLALAMGPEDPRADTLVLSASRQVLADRDDEASDPSMLRWTDRSARVYGAVLEATSRFEVGHPRAGEVAGRLLALRGGRVGYPWATALETARGLAALSAYAERWAWPEGEGPTARLDGDALPAVARSRAGASYPLPIRRLRGAHTLRVEGGDEGPVFFAIDGRWAVPLGEPDAVARGRRTAVHRVFETPDGRPLEDGAAVPLGAMVRVRLFVFTEGEAPEVVGLRDPLAAGFEAVDGGHDSTPRASLNALLGMGPDDGAVDARAHYAMRSLSSVAHRRFDDEAASFYFDRLPGGLQEYTYAVRATTVGEFTVPPAQIEALHDPGFVARSAMSRLRVVRPERSDASEAAREGAPRGEGEAR